MRQIVYLLVLAAAGYLGYTYYKEHLQPAEEPTEVATTVTSNAPVRETAPTPPVGPPPFQSKIEIPAGTEKHTAPPGTFYMLDRVTVEHASGIAALIPGDKVKLMQRKGDGTMKVTTGRFDVEVKEAQVTNDLDIARSAEEKYARAHPLKQ